MLYSLAESCYIHYILEARSFRAFLLQPRTTTHHGPVGRQQLHAPVPDLVALVPETNNYGAVLKKTDISQILMVTIVIIFSRPFKWP
jgi:hypothetical protein